MDTEPDTAVDVAQAAALTDLTPAAIRSRIRRGSLTSATRDGRRWIPVAELQRLDLVHTERRFRRLRERVSDLERRLRSAEVARDQAMSELHATAEARALAERESEELVQKLRVVTDGDPDARGGRRGGLR